MAAVVLILAGCGSSGGSKVCVSSNDGEVCAQGNESGYEFTASGLEPGTEVFMEVLGFAEPARYQVTQNGSLDSAVGFLTPSEEPITVRISATDAAGAAIEGTLTAER